MENSEGMGNLEVNLEDDQTIVVKGTAKPGYQGVLNFGIGNRGEVPMNYVHSGSAIVEGVHIELVGPTETIIHTDSSTIPDHGKGSLYLRVDQTGIYEFETELLFRLWNRYMSTHEDGSVWEKKLGIRVYIEVVNPEIISP